MQHLEMITVLFLKARWPLMVDHGNVLSVTQIQFNLILFVYHF